MTLESNESDELLMMTVRIRLKFVSNYWYNSAGLENLNAEIRE